jgi:hypothetical protein
VANHIVRSYVWSPLLHNQRFNRNGMLPHASGLRLIADDFNFISHRHKKMIQTQTQPLNAVQSSKTTTAVNPWPCYFRTGEVSSQLRIVLGLAPASGHGAGREECYVTIRDETGAATFGTEYFVARSDGSSTVTPGALYHMDRVVTGLTPNNEYSLLWTLNFARLAYLAVSEEPDRGANDATTGVCNPAAFQAESEIYDAHIGDLVDANNKLWRHNGAHLITACPSYDYATASSLSTTTSTSYVNVYDGVSTTVTAGTAGFNIFAQYHNTTNRTTVPVKFAYCLDRTAGAGTTSIQITDGTNKIEVTGIGDNAGLWATTTGTIPAPAGTKWDIQYKVSVGTTTAKFLGAALFEWES